MSLNKTHKIILWAVIHISIVLVFLFQGNLLVNTSLYSILPDTNDAKRLSEVEEQLTSSLNSSMTVLIGAKDFENCKIISDEFYNNILKIEGLESVQLKLGGDSIGKVQDFLYDFRYQFLSPEIKKLLELGEVNKLSERAYFTITSPVSMGFLNYLDTDPFLLSYENFNSFLNSGLVGNMAVGIRDSYLSRDYNGKSWILLTMKLTNNGVDTEKSPIPLIYNISDELKTKFSNTEFVYSGVPFHTFETAKASQREISLLSTISSIFILILVLFVFRSIKPLISIILTITVGMIVGFLITSIVFSEIHIFTIVFGTSLIGISVDYTFHFFSEWATNTKRINSLGIVKEIFPGITVGLITTIISYGAFTLSPFPLLQQIALFSISGLLSTYLTVIFIFPVLGTVKNSKTSHVLSVSKKIQSLFNFALKKRKIAIVFVLLSALILFIFTLPNVRLNNNIRDLYNMSEKLLGWEQKSSQILDHGSSGIYFLIEGKNLNDNMKIEEKLIDSLENHKTNGELLNYLSMSMFLPSIDSQIKNSSLIYNTLEPYTKDQLNFLGFDDLAFNNWKVDFNKNRGKRISIDDLNKLPISTVVDNINIGFVNGKYYTAVQLFGITGLQEIKDTADITNNVFLINKVDDTSNTLHELSRLAILILTISYVMIFFGLIPRYGFSHGLKVILIPIFASLITLSILYLTGHTINIFAVVGFILIPGMGTDYIILLTESKELENRVILSISLSMATTVLSFGLLGFTGIAGTFGLTVATGVFTTYLLTIIFNNSKSQELGKSKNITEL